MRLVKNLAALHRQSNTFRVVLATAAHEGPTTQDGTEHLMTVSRLLFEGTIATCHPPCIAEVVVKVLVEVAECVIRSPKDTRSWTGSESECRGAVCHGVLRNSTFIP